MRITEIESIILQHDMQEELGSPRAITTSEPLTWYSCTPTRV
ncbi:MAG: hypothetical protein Ct9H300mP1_07500 [Planctomycetaceae bacterium]|nr:MAG: hypothetical protein Ct9H300mP1_07500 [Planctomycetaceae bacterium]